MSISGISSSSSTLQELLASWGSDQTSQITQSATSSLASLFGGSDDDEGTTQASGLFSNRDKLIAMMKEGDQGTAFAQTASLLGQLDKDVNGGLSLKESGLEQDSFNALDTDGDGTVTGFELEAALKSGVASIGDDGTLSVDTTAASDAAAQAYASLSAMIMGLADTDKSGGLTAEETGLEEDTFNQFDLDGDGVISGDELTTALKGGSTSSTDSSLTAQGSGSASGVLSGGAASGASGTGSDAGDDEDEDYDELDTNKDGMISTEELAAAIPGYADALRLARGENGSDTSTAELRRAMNAYGSAGGFDFASLFATADATSTSAGVSGLLEEIA
ncbi:calcium-binding protein [Nitratidesulfovibrio sp. SRB-5]|uniref:calcium-binding protein n=1 Tax=Nitratidesulfovibrio sp. SRB-5 TaxID=2872636 RepID=UPI0010271322|nr:calcium-binding protein [Nitratidesulfovibrio sp. SRB-5]MBZ2172890.1 calcium-binding protein [Nitratidesulfovibrio sp. SRB-5]RXF76959.1 calcium-binding protein [Desulfovibrio sp. DS-1]